MLKAGGTVVSPCVGLCRIDDDLRWCLGCARTIDEIVAWGTASSQRRIEILSALPARLAELAGRSPETADPVAVEGGTPC